MKVCKDNVEIIFNDTRMTNFKNKLYRMNKSVEDSKKMIDNLGDTITESMKKELYTFAEKECGRVPLWQMVMNREKSI